MKKTYWKTLKILAVSLCFLTQIGSAGAENKEGDVRMDVTLNSDSFFGFYPTFQGGYGINEDLEFTMYGILWSGGVGENWGNWTEAGFGLKFELAEGLMLNPQVGFLAGNLLSSGTSNNTVAGDGWVPNVTLDLDKERFLGQVYVGYYDSLQNRAVGETGTTLEFLHYWANFGAKINHNFSAGVHWESLVRSGGSNTTSTDVYEWLGAFVQLAKPESKFFARITAGPDLSAGESFAKATVGWGF